MTSSFRNDGRTIVYAAATGFRNVLAHEYGHVNDEEVYETLRTGLSVYDTYSQHVARWMQTTDE